MIFPAWTRRSNMNKQAKASARLRYLINRLAVEYSPAGTLKSVADAVDINYSTILIYIERGKFSEPLAEKFELVFGIPAADLLDPLSISDK